LVSEQRTVLFVCLHGMGMSRLPAACFNRVAPGRWQAISAGVEPGETLSPTAARLLSGTPAEPFLDRAAPRSIDSAPAADRVIAICNPSIRFEVPGAESWDLTSAEFDEHMREEIRARAELLAEELAIDRGDVEVANG
jgi:arsenate reductase